MPKRRQVCPYCGRRYFATPESFAENPFCRLCLNERIAKASAAMGPTRLVDCGDGYVMAVADPPNTEQGSDR